VALQVVFFMAATIQAPKEMMESVADLRLPANADRKLQSLMDRNNNGELNGEERDELAALAEWSESISLLRAQALHLLRRKPQ